MMVDRPSRDYITVVSGLPRSGTSMMMRMLEAGGMPVVVDHQRRPDPDNPNGYYEFERVKKLKDDTAWLDDVSGAAVKVIYTLLYDLPTNRRFRCIFMRRNLEEIIASQEAMLKRLGNDGPGPSAADLMRLFQAHLRKVEAWLAEQDHIEVISVWYNDVISDPSGMAEMVNDFLDGGLACEAMAAAVDAGLHRQRASSLSQAR